VSGQACLRCRWRVRSLPHSSQPGRTIQVPRADVQGDILGPRREFSINTRRRRIAAIHNELRKLIKACEYVFLIEDDGVLPADSLSRLLSDYQAHPYAGLIEDADVGFGTAHR
jgi:membrane glycosyltransferase